MTRKLFDSSNAGYAQALYEQYARNPNSVPEEWRAFFAQGPDATREAGLITPESLSANGAYGAFSRPEDGEPDESWEIAPWDEDGGAPATTAARTGPAPEVHPARAADTDEERERLRRLLPVVSRATAFIQAFREHGHQLAQLDPLGGAPPGHPALDPSFFGTSMEELEEVPAGVVLENGRDESLAETLRRLRAVYTGSVGYEFEHLDDPEKVRWLWGQVESGLHTRDLSGEEKRNLLERLSQVEGFEQFLHRAYLGQKRFSIEGTDTMVPMLDLAIHEVAEANGHEVVLGMAHRGRLNVLAHIVGVSYEELIGEFEGDPLPDGILSAASAGTGDVKYHHGARGEYSLGEGRSVGIRIVPNPSHLEFVNPVVEGIVRVLQFRGTGGDAGRDPDSVVPILIHGDAAFAAEGVVAETLNLARLEGYDTGGTIHLIANNQIGFTTTPAEGRSTRYSSDLAKGYGIPVIHVNADDPEACLAAMRLAMAYRLRYKDDVVIDLVGYRRHGHNEGDEPAYTQPLLYEKIEDHPTVRTRWAEKLVEEGVVTQEEVDAIADRVAERLREAQDTAREANGSGNGDESSDGTAKAPVVETAVDLGLLTELNEIALTWPEGFKVHPKLARQLEKRRTDFGAETTLEWAHAETLAFASLLREGTPIRLTGQDTERGTFSQRHLVLHDVETGELTIPLFQAGDARFEIYNSPLTETATVGFEYGYSVGAERDLVLWEAQFGDFGNVAQVMIDQFIASGRAKWGQNSRLALLLPHGYEGQGPEHSSARLERFLQLCAEDNLRVAYPSTPAQYFHLLRRQALAEEERPLVVMTPKSLLRHPRATSRVSELASGRFQPVLDEPGREQRKGVRRLILCSGKVYYDLQAAEGRTDAEDSAVCRIEELYPFPADDLGALVERYPDLEEVVWTQEEPRNMGALTYLGPRLRAAVPRAIALRYVARPERSSPAEGKTTHHAKAQAKLVHEALTGR